MATSNRERQKRFYESRTQTGASRISCWLPAEDNRRLQRLIEQMSETGNDKTGYADVISEALKRLEIEMTPAGAKSMMRYGLLYLNNVNNEGKNERR
ncbi:hypothetical protein [Methylotuvimicrobium sp. KM1]|uniref:hypothetical protein n=1 Tax=Methylotuvimicrobium sp. KM1 TaxID=3377707 RepID=UPI00384A7E2F